MGPAEGGAHMNLRSLSKNSEHGRKLCVPSRRVCSHAPRVSFVVMENVYGS